MPMLITIYSEVRGRGALSPIGRCSWMESLLLGKIRQKVSGKQYFFAQSDIGLSLAEKKTLHFAGKLLYF